MTSGINTGRVVLGGIVAGIVINLLEFAGSLIYGEQSMEAFKAHNPPPAPLHDWRGAGGGPPAAEA